MELILHQFNQSFSKARIGSVFHGAAAYPDLAGVSLLEAMTFDGGEEQVVAAVNSALAAGERTTMLELAEQLASYL